MDATIEAGNTLQDRQPTPTDIQYSIPRWLLMRRAYFLNGLRERAQALPCPIADVPLAHVVLIDQGAVVGRYVIEGMVLSVNTYLTPDSEYYEVIYGGTNSKYNKWLPDIDGTYGENDPNAVFFFCPDGTYHETTLKYIYSDVPVEVADPVLKVGAPQ